MHQRQWLRFPSEIGTVTLRADRDQHLVAHVLDESFTGMGIAMEDIGPFEEDDHVRVSYRGLPMDAKVRHVSRMANGRYRVGVEWMAHRPALRLVVEE